MSIELCRVPACPNETNKTGLCDGHYQRVKKHGESANLTTPLRTKKQKARCGAEKCQRDAVSLGFCKLHYGRKAHGRAMDAPVRFKPGEWGKWRTNYAGYISRQRTIVAPGEKSRREHQLQHRLVMETYLGRRLLTHENVHHIDGNKTNNDLNNLELWSTSQPSGQRVSDKLNWARKFLAQYENQENE